MNIRKTEKKNLQSCAEVYISAYQSEPWNENHNMEEVVQYLLSYLDVHGRFCFYFEEKDRIIGTALGFIVPCVTSSYMRIEDFCVSLNYQRQGYGASMMNLIQKEAFKLGCDCILLNTQRDYPSHQFYKKLGFQEIESVLMYKEIQENKD